MSFGSQNFVFLLCISSQIRVSFAVSSSDGYDLQRGIDDEFRNIECDSKQSRCTMEQCERRNAKCSDNSCRVCRCPNRGTFLVFPDLVGKCSKDEDLVKAFGCYHFEKLVAHLNRKSCKKSCFRFYFPELTGENACYLNWSESKVMFQNDQEWHSISSYLNETQNSITSIPYGKSMIKLKIQGHAVQILSNSLVKLSVSCGNGKNRCILMKFHSHDERTWAANNSINRNKLTAIAACLSGGICVLVVLVCLFFKWNRNRLKKSASTQVNTDAQETIEEPETSEEDMLCMHPNPLYRKNHQLITAQNDPGKKAQNDKKRNGLHKVLYSDKIWPVMTDDPISSTSNTIVDRPVKSFEKPPSTKDCSEMEESLEELEVSNSMDRKRRILTKALSKSPSTPLQTADFPYGQGIDTSKAVKPYHYVTIDPSMNYDRVMEEDVQLLVDNARRAKFADEELQDGIPTISNNGYAVPRGCNAQSNEERKVDNKDSYYNFEAIQCKAHCENLEPSELGYIAPEEINVPSPKYRFHKILNEANEHYDQPSPQKDLSAKSRDPTMKTLFTEGHYYGNNTNEHMTNEHYVQPSPQNYLSTVSRDAMIKTLYTEGHYYANDTFIRVNNSKGGKKIDEENYVDMNCA
ncbi:uncharacterized protein LOC124434765 isoform X2 [Xenia sp. Carnegie-2017]|uniref:uncharacterized protein LOC124434765 isoform X2 n=1 Tax=Xenia sp. Carnegie-2017 TaxID=2897299 RepID=UPI001F03A285|nr:uncharacterized protein LOC124434765 isoform X2 [Xenia sp. Carnegie-2017]